jgi:hypothetical protein
VEVKEFNRLKQLELSEAERVERWGTRQLVQGWEQVRQVA